MSRFLRLLSKIDIGLLFVIISSIVFLFPLFKPGFYTMYDDMQVARLWQMDICIKDGQIPCRWVPDLGLGYGYPLFSYYAPFSYYLMDTVHLLGVPYVDSVKIGFILSGILSAVFFYKYLRFRFSESISFVGSFLFIFAPYKASDLYVRGAMGELWGMMSVSLLLFSIEAMFHKNGLVSKITLTASVFIFLISHNLTVLMFSPFIILYLVIRFIEERYNFSKIIQYFLPAVLGAGMSAFYLIPMYFEKSLVHIDTLTSGYFGYLQHFLSVKQIFISSDWGYGPSILGPYDETFLGIGPIHTVIFIFSALLFLYFGIKNHSSNNKNKFSSFLPIFLILSLLSFAFLTHERSTFIYKSLPLLQYIQFPWRYIMLPVFIVPILLSLALQLIPKNLMYTVAGVLILAVTVIYVPIFKPKDRFLLTDSQKLSGELLQKQLTASIYDYLPSVAKKAPDNVPDYHLMGIEGAFREITYEKGSNWYAVNVEVYSEKAKVVLPSYNYPIWLVFSDKKQVEVASYGDYGQVSFWLDKGVHKVFAKQTNTPVKVISDSISILSFAGALSYVAYEKNKKYISK